MSAKDVMTCNCMFSKGNNIIVNENCPVHGT